MFYFYKQEVEAITIPGLITEEAEVQQEQEQVVGAVQDTDTDKEWQEQAVGEVEDTDQDRMARVKPVGHKEAEYKRENTSEVVIFSILYLSVLIRVCLLLFSSAESCPVRVV